LLWGAYGISAFGDHLSELGLMRLLEVEHSHRQVQTQALMTFVFFLPYFLFGWFAGVVADRWSRKYVMIVADVARCVIVLILPAWVVWQVTSKGAELQQQDLLLAVMPLMALGLFAAFFSPARSALLPQLVRDRQLTRANSFISGLGTIAALCSQVVGGVLAQISPMLNFRTDAGTFAASALLVAGIKPPAGPARKRKAEAVGRAVREGLRYLRTHRRAAELTLLAATFWTAAAIFSSVLPSVVFRRYELNYAWLGAMRGTLATGMLSGALVLAYLSDSIRGEFVNFLAFVGAGTALVAFAWADTLYAGIILAFLVGAAGAGLLISVNTMLQRIVPNRWRGRIFGLVDMATIAGLLAATGLLGLAPIRGLDEHVPQILTGLGLGMIAAGMAMHAVLARRVGMRWLDLLLYRLNEFYCKWWFRLERIGPCRLPRQGGAIVAANHTSSIDPLLIQATGNYRPIGFMVAEEYATLPVIRRLLRRIGCIPTTRSGQDTAATRAALRHLESGNLLGIFPEGRIPRPGEVVTAKAGIALIALAAKVPVVPAHISGTRYTTSVLGAFLHRHRARVRYGRPIDLSAYYDRQADKAALLEAARLIMRRIEALGPQGDGA